MIGVEQHLPSQQDAGDPKQPIGHAAQGAAVGVAAHPEDLVAAAAFGVVQHGRPAQWNTAWRSRDLELWPKLGDGDVREAAYRGG